MEEIINEGRVEVEELLGAPLPKVDEHITTDSVADAIRWLMNASDMRSAGLAKALNVSRQAISELKHSRRKSIVTGTLTKVASACGYALALVPTDKLGMLPEDALVIMPEDKEG